MGRYVRMDPEPVFGQSVPPAPRASFPLVVIRQVFWNLVGPPAPVIRSKFKSGGWGRGFFGLARGVRR